MGFENVSTSGESKVIPEESPAPRTPLLSQSSDEWGTEDYDTDDFLPERSTTPFPAPSAVVGEDAGIKVIPEESPAPRTPQARSGPTR